MKRLEEIFDIQYGSQLDLNKCLLCEKPDGYNFVNRSEKNCGVSARILEENKKPFPAGLITVAMGGTVLSSFVQQEPFYTGQNVKVLKPKKDMPDIIKLYYCHCIEANRFRFSTFGREANYSFDYILVPDIDEIPKELNKISISDYEFEKKPVSGKKLQLDTENWKWFRYDKIFDIKKGFYNKKPNDDIAGNVPFIGATFLNNGITSFHNLETIKSTSKTGKEPNAPLEKKMFKPNCITVSNNGSVGFAFYQPQEFTCTHDVNPLFLKTKNLNVYIAMFLCALIETEKYRWAYGRKWRPKRMPSSLIKLPVKTDGNPDWQFMEDYIKTLPYSKGL